MDSEYQQSEEEFEAQQCDPEEFEPRRKRLTKNQQIYGDFFEAYEPEPAYIFSKPSSSYGQFKAGATIESYSSEVEVSLPIKKPKSKQTSKLMEQDQQDEKPMLGQFNLNSFLNQLGKDDLNDIAQEENQDSSEQMPVGLHDKILEHLQLVRIGDEQTEEAVDIQKMSFERYMKMGRPAPPPPKYKTQEEKELAKEYKESYGVGFKMLENMGFNNISKGLGKNQTGIHKPVEAVHKTAFTMKDSAAGKQKKAADQKQSEASQEELQPQKPIAEQLFAFRSKNPKINNFLLSLQKDYERLNSQIYFLQNQVNSMKNKLEVNLSMQCQQQNQVDQLKRQIQKLEVIGQNIEQCIQYPHLGEHYQIDVLFVKKVYDKFRSNGFDFIHQHGQQEILGLKSALYKFYLAKSKQSIRMFQQSTAIEQKIHKNINKKHKKQQEIIDLDKEGEDEVEVVTIGVDEEQKIKKFIDLILAKTIVPHIDSVLTRAQNLSKVKEPRVIELIDLLSKFDDKQSLVNKLLIDTIMPLYQNYVNKLNLEDLQAQKSKVLPHHVILPWLHILKRSKAFTLLKLYKVLARKLWNIESSILYNIVTPLLKFSTNKDISYFINLCLAPRILNQLQSFTIANPNPALLAGFTKYSQLLQKSIKDEILESTLFVEVNQIYSIYVKEKDQSQVLKWLKGWRKFSDKISPGRFVDYFGQKIRLE